MSVDRVTHVRAQHGRIRIEETDRPDVYKITRRRGGEADPVGHISGFDLRDLVDTLSELLDYLETMGEEA